MIHWQSLPDGGMTKHVSVEALQMRYNNFPTSESGTMKMKQNSSSTCTTQFDIDSKCVGEDYRRLHFSSSRALSQMSRHG